MIDIKEIKTITGLGVNVDLPRLKVYISKHLDYMTRLLTELGYEDPRQDALNHLAISFMRKNKRLDSIYYVVT